MQDCASAIDRKLAIALGVREQDRHDHGEREQNVLSRYRGAHATELLRSFDEGFHRCEGTLGELPGRARIPIRDHVREPRDIALHIKQMMVKILCAAGLIGQGRRTGFDLRHIVAKDFEGKLLTVGEVPMQGGPTDPCRARNLVERGIGALFGDDSTSGVEEKRSIARRIAPARNFCHFGIVSAGGARFAR